MFQYDINRLIQQIIITHSQGPTSWTIKNCRHHTVNPGISSPYSAHGKLYVSAEYLPNTYFISFCFVSITACNWHLLNKIINSLKAEPLPCFICIPQEAYSMLNILLSTQLVFVEINYFLNGFFDKGLWQANIFTQDQSRNYSQEGLPASCGKIGYLYCLTQHL